MKKKEIQAIQDEKLDELLEYEKSPETVRFSVIRKYIRTDRETVVQGKNQSNT